MADMRTTKLSSGDDIPVLGLGTWYLGEDTRRRAEEIGALQLGIDLGMTLVDTAEMYGEGASEELVGEAIVGRRDKVFLVSKVLPTNATAAGTVAACERSLRRLRTERLDLYLLHWRGSVSLGATLAGFGALLQAGKIRYWGVSNFDVDDMRELVALPGGSTVATDQVLYNLTRRGIELDLLPWCSSRRVPIMAYSPIEQGRLARKSGVTEITRRHGVSPAQLALAWAIRSGGVCAIPRSGNAQHVRENRSALDVRLTAEDLADLDRLFPPPRSKQPLEMI